MSVNCNGDELDSDYGLDSDDGEEQRLENAAHDAILDWCRSRRSVGLIRPVMRDGKGGRVEVLDASYFGRHVIADGYSWVDCLEQLRKMGNEV